MARADTITSAANPLIKDVRRAIARGSLTEQGWCVAETFHLLEEALHSECEIRIVLAAESAQNAVEAHTGRSGVKVAYLPDSLFQSIAGTQTTQGVMALVQLPEWKPEHLFRGRPLVVVLDALQDPGNAGTIARAAEAFGATGMLFLKGTVSPWNPKALRASAGSLFRVPFLHGLEAAEALPVLRRHAVELFAAVPAGAVSHNVTPLTKVDLTKPSGLIIGSESHGVCDEMRAAARDISIPTAVVESLNAAVAAAILLYEASRQRMPRP